MSAFDPINHIVSRREKVDFIVPERIRDLCVIKGWDYEKAALMCDIDVHEFGLMANGHKDIPKELIFNLQRGFGYPAGFFYFIKWERV